MLEKTEDTEACVSLIAASLSARVLADLAYRVKRDGEYYNLPWQELYNSTAAKITEVARLPADYWVGTSGDTVLDKVLAEGVFA